MNAKLYAQVHLLYILLATTPILILSLYLSCEAFQAFRVNYDEFVAWCFTTRADEDRKGEVSEITELLHLVGFQQHFCL